MPTISFQTFFQILDIEIRIPAIATNFVYDFSEFNGSFVLKIAQPFVFFISSIS